MTEDAGLALFAHVVSRPEGDIDLARAALLVAEPEYPNLDIPHYVAQLDHFGARARAAAASLPAGEARVQRVLSLLFEEVGFHGNEVDYYDPRNSFLNEVLDRRAGIPITLALVIAEVMVRAGIPAEGVSFPGHFLVRVPAEGGLYLADPFTGRLMTAQDLRSLFHRATGRDGEPEPDLLAAASKHQILMRMLQNLRSIYARRGDHRRLLHVVERMAALSPSDEALGQDLKRLGGRRPPKSPAGMLPS